MGETREQLDGLNLAGNALLDYQAQLAAMGFGSGISLRPCTPLLLKG